MYVHRPGSHVGMQNCKNYVDKSGHLHVYKLSVCICMPACLYKYIYIYEYMCLRTWMHTCKQPHTHVHLRSIASARVPVCPRARDHVSCLCVHVHARPTNVHAYMPVCMYACVPCANVQALVSTCTSHLHMHTNKHVHIHMYRGCVGVCIHTYNHTCTHMRTCAILVYTSMSSSSNINNNNHHQQPQQH